MFIIKPEIGERAWVVTSPHVIKNEILIIHLAGIIEEKHIGVYDYKSGKEMLYFINEYYIPIHRIGYFQFGGITIKNDRFNEVKCLREDNETIKDYNSKAGKELNVTKIIEQSWWQ